MKNVFVEKIINIFLILTIILISKEAIINNPVLISEHGNPITLLSSDNNYYIVCTSGEIVRVKTSGEIQSRNTFPTYNAPYIWMTDESSNHFLYCSSDMYKITLPNGYTSITKPSITYPQSWIYLGYIAETKTSGGIYQGCLCEVLQDELIIYGRTNDYYITFSFLKKAVFYTIIVGDSKMEHKMSCKRIENGQYLCTFLYGYIVNVYVFSHLLDSSLQCSMKKTKVISMSNTLNNHVNLEVYDTNVINKKLICAVNRDTSENECLLIMVQISKTTGYYSCVQRVIYSTSEIIIKSPSQNPTTQECVITTLSSENLLCCAGTDKIKCSRILQDNTLKQTFDIEIQGANSKLKIFSDHTSYANFFFMNKLSDQNKIYEYTIYIPTCSDLDYSIIVYHSINENRAGNEDNLSDLFTRKTNTEYYFEFEDLPDEFGDLLVNGQKLILENNTKFLLKNGEDYILDFNSTNDKTVTNFQIPYTISIKESYSASCKITLSILPCYDSCLRCSKDKSQSTPQDHNCIEDKCKVGYYPSPLILTNCFSEDEKELNWYLDYNIMRFALCDNKCSSCYGPNQDNCLTCFDPNDKPDLAYLYHEACINECPEGTYSVQQPEKYYKCKNCYENCKTCSESGNYNTMKCDSCFENNIKYGTNCYKLYSDSEKTFYKPESDTEITSCHELLGIFIEENNYECVISIPSSGYFLVNSVTGLFAKCHNDCKACSQRENDISSNCDECINEEYYLLDGNCIQNCPDGYYSTISSGIKICKKCYKNCMTCNQGEIKNNLNQITNMNCLTCKKGVDPSNSNNLIDNQIQIEGNCFPIITNTEEKINFDITDLSIGETEKTCLEYGLSIIFGEYKCISKPENSYYVVNNNENTGVIKLCDISCATCNNGKIISTGDTNCITCKEGYFKKEDSNTNCILETLIPENYFKNPSDNIFYKCYTSCKKCSDFYNSENDNMNCIECITNYYFVYETNNCYPMSFIDDKDYFFNNKDNKFHKCYYSCLKCSQLELDEYHHNCDECISDYYFEYSTKNCYDMSVLERGYYFDDFTINEGEIPVFKKCYENCKTCNNAYIDNNMNCILCKDDYYKKFGTNNCYDETLTEQGYYLKDNIFYPCDQNCKTCSNSKTTINGITSNNCLSCDSITKSRYLVSDLKNCELESFKVHGYYLSESQDNPDIKIFYKCFISCSLCDKGKEFDLETNQDNHNCLTCRENYYHLKNDLNPNNCYNEEEMKPKKYYLVRNYWTICHENCGTCDERPEYDNNNKLISQNCLTCYKDLHFIYNTLDCSDDSILEKGYYFDDNDLKYHKCNIQCKSCEKYSTNTDPKCKSCNTDSGYYLAINKPTSRCYNQETIESQYTLSEIEDETTGQTIKKWMICYDKCRTCNKFGNELENNCLSCISKYYLIYGTSNCIKGDEAKKDGYYFNTTYGKYVKCDIACSTCNLGDNLNCIKCNEALGYYPYKGKSNSMCFNEETIGDGYFLNTFEKPYGWDECYENCAKCEYKGNKKKMACLSCKTDLRNEEYNKTIYLKKVKTNCVIGCPNNLFLTKQFDCLPSCLNGTYEYIPNVTCVDTCPQNYEINPERTRCVFSEFIGATSPDQFTETISTNISQFIDPETVINGTTFIAQIISSSDVDPVEQIKNGISGLDFGECIEVLKEKYNIPPNEDLIILEIETKEDKEKNKDLNRDKDRINLGKNVTVSIYDFAGNLLDMSLCDNEITVMKYIGDVEDIDINMAMDFADQGIDIFNTKDAFFNDRCSKYNSDKDIILGDRRTDLYQNVSFCGDDCLYSGMDYNLMIAKCSCSGADLQNRDEDIIDDEKEKKGITLNDLANSFTSEIFTFNFDVIKCYNLVFDIDILKKNQGFFSNVIMISLQIFFFIYFLARKLKPIRNYMLVFEPYDPRIDPPNPPKKKLNFETQYYENRKGYLYNLLNLKNDNNNNNLTNRQKELQKSILINGLLNKNKIKKKKDGNDKIRDDDALVVHFENSEDSSSEKSEEKNKSNDYNSDSNSDYYKKKKDNSILKYLQFEQKNTNFKESKKDGKIPSLIKRKNNFSNPKINNRNNKELISTQIFSKETIASGISKNKYKGVDIYQKEALTLATNNISPRIIENDSYKHRKKNKNYISRYSNESKPKKAVLDFKDKDIKEKVEESEDIKNISLENSNDSESIDKKSKKKKKINKNKSLKRSLKNREKRRNSSILVSTDDLFPNDRFRKIGESRSVIYYPKKKVRENPKKINSINELNYHTKSKKTESELYKKTEEKNKKLGNMRLKFKRINYSLTSEELNDLDYEDALENDHRSFFRIYVSYLLAEHIIFNTFCTDLYLELRAIKLSFLLFGIEINFFLNAVFYTDEYISDTYHNNGVLDFFSSLPKSIYSFLVTIIISSLLKMLSNSKKQLNEIIKKREDKKEYLTAVEKELNKLKKKLIWYYILVFLLGIFFSYYTSSFCAVYQNSQTFWLIGCLESVFLDFLTPFLICLLLSCLRYLGLRRRTKCAYNTAKYLGILL